MGGGTSFFMAFLGDSNEAFFDISCEDSIASSALAGIVSSGVSLDMVGSCCISAAAGTGLSVDEGTPSEVVEVSEIVVVLASPVHAGSTLTAGVVAGVFSAEGALAVVEAVGPCGLAGLFLFLFLFLDGIAFVVEPVD